MNKNWKAPGLIGLDISNTMNNVTVFSEEDHVKAGDYGDNPQGYVCELDCS